MTETQALSPQELSTSRRQALKGMGAAAVAAGLPGLALAQTKTIRIGYISPLTGPQAPFGETDKYMVAKVQALLKDGLTINGTKYAVEILVRDNQSNPNKAAELAGNLILNEKVHLMLPASTTDAINPVSDQCELNGVPCLSSQAPWQSFVFPRGGSAEKPFKWTYHFFWGLEDVLASFTGTTGTETHGYIYKWNERSIADLNRFADYSFHFNHIFEFFKNRL